MTRQQPRIEIVTAAHAVAEHQRNALAAIELLDALGTGGRRRECERREGNNTFPRLAGAEERTWVAGTSPAMAVLRVIHSVHQLITSAERYAETSRAACRANRR